MPNLALRPRPADIAVLLNRGAATAVGERWEERNVISLIGCEVYKGIEYHGKTNPLGSVAR